MQLQPALVLQPSLLLLLPRCIAAAAAVLHSCWCQLPLWACWQWPSALGTHLTSVRSGVLVCCHLIRSWHHRRSHLLPLTLPLLLLAPTPLLLCVCPSCHHWH